jgi:hypothetical protein
VADKETGGLWLSSACSGRREPGTGCDTLGEFTGAKMKNSILQAQGYDEEDARNLDAEERPASYDVFEQLQDGSMAWICQVHSLYEAKIRLRVLQDKRPGKYYVCDLLARKVLVAAAPDRPGLYQAPDEAFFGALPRM